jgi:TolB-like protein/class 3 adenylate cyclase
MFQKISGVWEQEPMAEDRVERKLAAILAADVVGYSRLMNEDEAATLARLKALRRELFEPNTKEHRGRIFKTMGDGALVEFRSAVDAVNCAVDIQRALAERKEDVTENCRIRLRIGVSLGDVIVEGSDLYGRGVNVAARMESLAEPGGICISGNVHEHVRGAAGLVFDDLGNQEIKNIPEPVRAYRVHLRGGVAGPDRPQPDTSPPLPDKPSIALLPFQNISGDPEQDYFCDGMVDDIITGLSRIKWLFVIARNTTLTYKGKAFDVKQVGHELGVRYVLEGSVRKAGDRVRINGQLIDAATGAHVWAERYDRKIDDVFALQDELTLSVVGAIEPSLRLAEVERVKLKRSDSLDAYDLVLQAQPDVYARMPAPSTKALVLLERAIALDPTYALAHAYAAECHHVIFLRGGLSEEHRAASIRHAEAAIAYGQDDALTLSFAGFVIGMDKHDRAAAFAAFEAALAVSPSSAITYFLGSILLAWAGESERAIEWGERGLRLSPLDPWRWAAFYSSALGHFQRGHYEEAAAAARKAIQYSPTFSQTHMVLAATVSKLGRLEEAKVAAARVLELQPAFRYSRLFAGMDCEPALVAALSEALRAAGLPE